MKEADAFLRLWDYMQLRQEPQPSDVIVGFGCYNEDVALRAAQLYLDGMAPLVVFSGGLGRNTSAMWSGTTEAERFCNAALAQGVPESAILLENRSTNSAENLLFTRQMLMDRGIAAERILAVHKPYMERRLASAFPVYWPEARVIVTSYQQTPQEYIRGVSRWGRNEKMTIEMVTGDFARIIHYAELGYQLPQQIPDQVMNAFRELCALGYTAQVPASFYIK